jgi:hypothetical protein
MENASPRFGLPQLVVSQAHKEITHNEALAIIDALLHPAIEAIVNAPPTLIAADAGKCWLIDQAATGAFAGKANQIACWTGGSWRFLTPIDGMRLWHRGDQTTLFFADLQWITPQPVGLPSGGAVIDLEARSVLADIVARLNEAGILLAA